jgi:hypothetical protein
MNEPVTSVVGAPPPQPAAPPAQPAQPAQPDVSALQREIDDLKRQNGEFQRTAEFWHEKATAKPAAAPRAAEPAADPDDDVDLLEVLTTKGVSGLKQVLAKSGFVSREEAASMVNTKAAQIAKEAELLSAYPDLKKADSEFFKTTAQHYGQLKAAGVPEAMAMELAAEKTQLEFLRSGKAKTPAQKAEESKAQREADRLARIAAQAGDRGAPPPSDDGEDDDTLTDYEKHICAQMGISEEAFIKRAKSGVQMSARMQPAAPRKAA